MAPEGGGESVGDCNFHVVHKCSDDDGASTSSARSLGVCVCFFLGDVHKLVDTPSSGMRIFLEGCTIQEMPLWQDLLSILSNLIYIHVGFLFPYLSSLAISSVKCSKQVSDTCIIWT